MKRCIVALFLLLAIPYSALAAEGHKFGAVDVQKVLSMSDAGKAAKDQLSQKAGKYEAERNAKEAELKKLKGEIESQSSVLNESARAAKERDYQQRFKDYQRFQKDAQEDMQSKNEEFVSRIVDEVVKVAQEYGRKHGYTAIIIKSEVLLYLDPEADITEAVLKAFNESKKKQ